MIAPRDCFSYELPPDRIAQRPVHPYDHAKMLVIKRGTSEFQDSTFSSFAELVEAGDLVIFNNSRVIPARLFGSVAGRTGEVELLLLREIKTDRWLALGRPRKKLSPGVEVDFGGSLQATVVEHRGDMELVVELRATSKDTSVKAAITNLGTMPVPPYIRGGKSDAQDRQDYQTMFAEIDGSVAAPTASLHFTPQVVDQIRARGAEVSFVTLHVGAASFLPLWREEQQTQAQLTPPGAERAVYSRNLMSSLDATKKRGRKVFAVGTTVVRALETFVRNREALDGLPFDTTLFITPGFEWRAVDVLVTIFHQPHTTHLLLVESFLGRALLSAAYSHALKSHYRFLSYGDGMVIVP